MTDEKKKPEEKKADEPQDKGYDYQADHLRPIQAIAKDPVIVPEENADGAGEKPAADNAPEEKPAPEKPSEPVNPLDEAKKYLEEQRKLDTEAAKKIAEDTTRETVEKELKKSRDDQEREAKEQDELKPVWLKEGRTPKDYDEIAAETRRITKLELKRDMRLEKEAEEKAQALKKQTEKPKTDPVDDTVNRIGREVEELFEGGYIPRPVKPGDPNDPGEKAKKALFEFGVKYNQDRVKEGKAPEPSIAKLFFLNAEKIREAVKGTQVAGADAPVSGAKPATVKHESDGYVYARDHRSGESVGEYARRIMDQNKRN